MNNININRKRLLEFVEPVLRSQSTKEDMDNKGKVYTEFLDMLIQYNVFLPEISSGEQIKSVVVTKDVLESTGLTLDEVHNTAINNIGDDYEIMSLREILEAEDIGMILVSNKKQLFGAAQILNNYVISNIVERLGNRFFIIPSSVHEMLILPAECSTNDLSELADIVKYVNTDYVIPEERLSDNAYLYDEGEIIIIE